MTIAATAATAAYAGLQLCLFEADVIRLDAAKVPPASAERRKWVAGTNQHRDVAEVLTHWRTTPGVAGTTRAIIVARLPWEAPGPRRLLDIAALLSERPTDGDNWLALTQETLRLSYGRKAALAAYDMSTITARREAASMYARALFVLHAWEEIPPDRRHAALRGLAELRWQLKEPQFKTIAALIVAKTPEARTKIREALPLTLRGDTKFQKAVGL